MDRIMDKQYLLCVVLLVALGLFVIVILRPSMESFRPRRDKKPKQNVLNKSSKNVLDIGKKFNHLKERFNNLFSS